MSSDLIVYQISRARIEAMNCSHVVATFDFNRSPREFQVSGLGRVMFVIEGYDAHPDELYTIPSVRRFLRQWHQMSPVWLYYGSLADDSLKVLYLGLLETLECVQIGGAGLCRTTYNTGELLNLLAADLRHADELYVRHGISPAQRLRRARETLEYFGLDGGGR